MDGFKESSTSGSRRRRGGLWTQFALVFSIGIVVILSATLNAFYRSRALFDEASDFMAADFRERVGLISAAQKGVQAFFGASVAVERGEFELFCGKMAQEWPFLSGFAYYGSPGPVGPGSGEPTYAYPENKGFFDSPYRFIVPGRPEYAYYSAKDGSLVFLSRPEGDSILAIGMDAASLLEGMPDHGRLSARVELLGPGDERITVWGRDSAASGSPHLLDFRYGDRVEALGREWLFSAESSLSLEPYDAFFLAVSGAIGMVFLALGFIMLKRSRGLALREEVLKRAERMDAAKILAREVAHDFNNALSGIVGTLSIIRAAMGKGAAVETIRLEGPVSIIEAAADRASEMVDRLRQVCEAGSERKERIDLAECAESVVELARNAVDPSVSIEWENAAGEGAACLADRTAIERALMNLVVNAAHSMTIMRPSGTEWGGTVRVRLESRRAGLAFRSKCRAQDPATRFWSISVEDDGVGIERADQANIFAPFFSTKGSHFGTGLGLSMAYETARSHSGFLDFTSKSGKGSTFILYLPAIS